MSGGSKGRPGFTRGQFDRGLQILAQEANARLDEKGDGIFISTHETLGVIAEEVFELTAAVQCKGHTPAMRKDHIRRELLDVAVAAVLGFISLDTGEQDWI